MKSDVSREVARKPLVSVLVPAYNAAPFLERSLGSALRQTMADLEVILADDASTDDTLATARRIAERDSRVRVLVNGTNQGEARTRNRLLAAARGTWIALLDADDAWLPERLDRLLSVGDGADVVADDLYRVETESGVAWSYLRGRARPPLHLQGPRTIDASAFLRHDLGTLQPIVRREFLERHAIQWDPAHRMSPDFFFSFGLLLRGARWIQVPEAYYLYYAHSGSALSQRWVAEAAGVFEATRALVNDPAVEASTRLRADLQRFLRFETVDLRVERVRILTGRRAWGALPGLLAEEPRSLPLLAAHVARRVLAKRRRARSSLRVQERPTGPVLMPR